MKRTRSVLTLVIALFGMGSVLPRANNGHDHSTDRRHWMESPTDAVCGVDKPGGARYEELVRRYGERPYATALGILHNRDDAGDAVQDAYLQAFRSMARPADRASSRSAAPPLDREPAPIP